MMTELSFLGKLFSLNKTLKSSCENVPANYWCTIFQMCYLFIFLITLHKSRSAVVMIKIAYISIILPREKNLTRTFCRWLMPRWVMWLLLSIRVLKPVFWKLKASQISSKPVEQREMTTQELKQIVHFNHKHFFFSCAIGSAQYILKQNGCTWVRRGIVA